MNEFELTIHGTTYKVSSTQSNHTDKNWTISAKYHDLTVGMTIPIESKVPKSKVMLFVDIFHTALMKAKEEQRSELTFPQQLT